MCSKMSIFLCIRAGASLRKDVRFFYTLTLSLTLLAGLSGKTMISEGMNATVEVVGANISLGDQDNASSPYDGAAMESVAGIIATSILLGIMTLITIVGEMR